MTEERLKQIIDGLLDKMEELREENRDLRNFACQLCGKYKTSHEGSCDGCRWHKI